MKLFLNGNRETALEFERVKKVDPNIPIKPLSYQEAGKIDTVKVIISEGRFKHEVFINEDGFYCE